MEPGADILKALNSRSQDKPQKPGATIPQTPTKPTNEGHVARGQKFEPIDLEKEPLKDQSGLPTELWSIAQAAPAIFPPRFFLDVMDNLLRNPNLTSSHLFRAEIFYDSEKDTTFNPTALSSEQIGSFVKHMKSEYRPRIAETYPGYTLERTVVRKLIPRNPKLDNPLVQTCHLFTSKQGALMPDDGAEARMKEERYLIIYIPHASTPSEIPWYHPPVRQLAILYSWKPSSLANHLLDGPPGTMSLYYNIFPATTLDTRLTRIALNMLRIIHKHSTGRMDGYTKRVHHDLIVSQKKHQDCYTYLKGKYAEALIRDWVEQTPATKHVFEDLGIAAFLMEVWMGMYGGGEEGCIRDESIEELWNGKTVEEEERRERAQKNFPGFVDVGCGNGLLVYILMQEGWRGWGFDARRRKTWDVYPHAVKGNLKEMLLVPEVFETYGTDTAASPQDTEPQSPSNTEPAIHNGMFPEGTFIIANHADELTIWTPCLAYLSRSPFVVIPCCSHDFSGARFRAPTSVQLQRPAVLNLDGTEEEASATGATKSNESTMEMSQASEDSALSMQTDGRSESKLASSKTPVLDGGEAQTPFHVYDSTRSQHRRENTDSTIAHRSFPLHDPSTATHPTNAEGVEVSESLPKNPSQPNKAKSSKSGKQPSAYASFCTYLTSLTAALGYVPEQEILRIPSTRNVAVLGRKFVDNRNELGMEERVDVVRTLVEREMGMGIRSVGERWLERGGLLRKSGKGSGH